ncbi:MAG TPA: glycine cleavage system protein H [Thermoanaerobaculaceae bacterium]|nr:glycine cleavage system protein H [Thermoanaerobaculaceae bacterium]
MFPGIDGFAWDTGHIVFLGAFYTVLLAIAATVSLAAMRSRRDFRLHHEQAIRWQAEFHDLPASCRRCRHELSGEVAERTCGLGFDCRRCAEHARLLAARSGGLPKAAVSDGVAAGFRVLADRRYHRGHAWVRREPDGSAVVGLDDLGTRLLGEPDAVELPPVGSRVEVNGTGWTLTRNGVRARILAPIDGTVTAHGGPDCGWALRVKPDGDGADDRHLLAGEEARRWTAREAERLQIALAADGVGAALADGGVPLDDIARAITPSELDAACGLVFLEP